eukprot:6212852-Pleurochrysis_carterae.AAC.4
MIRCKHQCMCEFGDQKRRRKPVKFADYGDGMQKGVQWQTPHGRYCNHRMMPTWERCRKTCLPATCNVPSSPTRMYPRQFGQRPTPAVPCSQMI